MTPEEIRKEIKETTAALKRKKSLLLKYEKERKIIYDNLTDLQIKLKEIDDVIIGKANKYYTQKEYDIPQYRWGSKSMALTKVPVTVKYAGLYQEVASLEEQLGVLKAIRREKPWHIHYQDERSYQAL